DVYPDAVELAPTVLRLDVADWIAVSPLVRRSQRFRRRSRWRTGPLQHLLWTYFSKATSLLCLRRSRLSCGGNFKARIDHPGRAAAGLAQDGVDAEMAVFALVNLRWFAIGRGIGCDSRVCRPSLCRFGGVGDHSVRR